MSAALMLEDDRFADLEGKVCDATKFALLAATVAEKFLSGGRDGSFVKMMPWEADLLIFAVHQAHFATVGAENQWKELAERGAR